MKCYTLPYKGDKPFLYFSFCDEDNSIALPIAERLILDGFRVWFDDRSLEGKEWEDEVGGRIRDCALCIVALSHATVNGHGSNNERNLAVMYDKPLVPILLEKNFTLPLGIELQLGETSRFACPEDITQGEAFFRQLSCVSGFAACRDPNRSASAEMLERWREHCMEYARERTTDTSVLKLTSLPRKDGRVSETPAKQKQGGDASETPDVPEKKKLKVVVKKKRKDPNHRTVALVPPQSAASVDPEPTIILDSAHRPVRCCIMDTASGKVYRMRKDSVAIGRDEGQADFVVPDPERIVSRYHADVLYRDSRFFLRDNDSKNGTFHDGERLEAESYVELRTVDEFILARKAFLFVSGEQKEVLENRRVGETLAWLKELSSAQIRLLKREPMRLGRDEPWDNKAIKQDHTISRKHAEILYEDGAYYLIDIQSKNGTFLNNRLLPHGEKKKLSDGDVIQIGQISFRFSCIRP